MPDYEDILVGVKAEITREHLLCMSSGLSWDEWSTSYEDPANDVVALFHEEDPIEYILSKPVTISQTDNLIPRSDSYGYQWWIMDFQANDQTYDCFFAAGWGDRYMFIFPDQEMIITINSGNFTGAVNMSIFAFVENHILPGLL